MDPARNPQPPAAAKRTLAVGDIHGCNTALTALLNAVGPTSTDLFVFLGDYIDRGPESRQVIESLLDLKKICAPVYLRGNHEAMILEAREDSLKDQLWQSYGGLDALFSYGANYRPDWVEIIPFDHWAFFEGTRKFFETDSTIFVHACLDPDLDMEAQPERLLYWESFDRLRPHKSGKKIICGHSPQRSGRIKDVGFAACIDTGVATGGWLSCLEINSRKYWQANEKGDTRDGVL
jgi:serine/threonine protein phosphatase 1